MHTVYYRNWKGLREEYCKTLINARKEKCSKYNQNDSNKEVADTKLQFSELSYDIT